MSQLTRAIGLASVLVLVVLMVGGLLLMLSRSDQPAEAALQFHQPEAAAVPAASLTRWLSDDDMADAPYSASSPTIDGRIGPGEYAGAGKVSFAGYGGEVEVFVKQDGANLYVAFDSPLTPFDPATPEPAFQVFLDTTNNKTPALESTDYRLTLDSLGNLEESQGDGVGWMPMLVTDWSAAVYTATWGWQGEFSVTLSSKLGIAPGLPVSIGLGLAEAETLFGPADRFWPTGGHDLDPFTWGNLVSTSEWDRFYWKPGLWQDYAPSGLPDFDQRQPGWAMGPISTHCGPVAMANSLWWFDSRFEASGGAVPPEVGDTYRLVRSYNPGLDDHDPDNLIPLVDELAFYFDTNGVRSGGGWSGTRITDMYSGTLAYLRDRGLWDDYLVTLVHQPEFDWIAEQAMHSEDVILLLGFWQEQPPGGVWVRLGGHYVTVAGVDATPGSEQLAISDPARDSAELPGPGRVLSGTLIAHEPIPGHPFDVHNDAGNVSHDKYVVTPGSPSPGGSWAIGGYEVPAFFLEGLDINPNPYWEGPLVSPTGDPIHTEIEFALAVSPYAWKASGKWNPVAGTWLPWEDYAPNGLPDFDQKQDKWTGPPSGNWTYCGPVAAADSLWWFDSKYEPNPVGPPLPPPYLQIPVYDHYSLVKSYGYPTWDDHDPLNVDDTLVSGTLEFVDDLAQRFKTNTIGGGTIITDLYKGMDKYLSDFDVRQGYVITMVNQPDFWWVAEEVEASEDVILLLGFWQLQGDRWVRLGGHYVTLPGVDKQGGLVAFSDPWFDRIEQTWPYAGVGGASGRPAYLGRVADGWLTRHLHPAAPPESTHNDAGNVSHDAYRAIDTDSPGGVWGPGEYLEEDEPTIDNFLGQNGQQDPASPTGAPVQTEVEWAVALSPVADLWIIKTVTPTVVSKGGWVTLTIAFGNEGSLPAENVIITDVLPPELVNPSWQHWTSGGMPITARPGSNYIWELPDLAWREQGVITVTAQFSFTLSGGALVTNTAQIGTSSVEQYQLAPLPNEDSATVQKRIYSLYLPLVLRNH